MPDEKEFRMLYHKWDMEDYHTFKDSLTCEQMGELFFAVMETAETGVTVKVSDSIKVPYRMSIRGAIAAHVKAVQTHETRVAAGRSGGIAKAKAAKARKEEQNTTAFKPPTKTEFKNMAKHIRAEYDLDLDAYEIDRLYDDLVGSGWNYRGAQLTTRKQIEAIIYAVASNDFNYTSAVRMFLEKGYTDLEAETLDILACDYDEDREAWQLVKGGPWYSTIEEAVDAYLSEDD